MAVSGDRLLDPERSNAQHPRVTSPPTPLRLVLDTNVWLDWLVFDDPRIAALRNAVAGGAAEIAISAACEAELERALAYPFRQRTPLPQSRQIACLATARQAARYVDASSLADTVRLPVCRDPDDQKFLELARDARADLLVSRDDALLILGRRRREPLPFRIVAPISLAAEFRPARLSDLTMDHA